MRTRDFASWSPSWHYIVCAFSDSLHPTSPKYAIQKTIWGQGHELAVEHRSQLCARKGSKRRPVNESLWDELVAPHLKARWSDFQAQARACVPAPRLLEFPLALDGALQAERLDRFLGCPVRTNTPAVVPRLHATPRGRMGTPKD